MENKIRAATSTDIDSIVALAEKKRLQYQTYQPLFWCKAANSAEIQKPYLENLIAQEHILALAYIEQDTMRGFVIANIGKGATCNIDDFAIADENEWNTVGKTLLHEVGRLALNHQITEYEVVCGHLDQPKRTMLQAVGLDVMRYWFTRAITFDGEAIERIHVRVAAASDAPDIALLLAHGDDMVAEIENERMIVLVAEQHEKICGCLIALVVPTPPVYDPSGDTCLVTELNVAETEDQDDICNALLNKLGRIAREKDAVQYVVMCDSTDQQTQSLLTSFGMTIASEWYQGKI